MDMDGAAVTARHPWSPHLRGHLLRFDRPPAPRPPLELAMASHAPKRSDSISSSRVGEAVSSIALRLSSTGWRMMNKPLSSSIGCGALFILLVAACESAPQANSFPSERTSYTQVEASENTSYGRVSRFSSRIIVPLGRTREELTAILEQAARKLAAETGADAVMVFAYREGDKPSGFYTAGRAIYAPNAKWEDADTGGPMRVQVDLNELYFAPPAVHAVVGDTVTLVSSYDDSASLSREYGAWGDEEIVARVANGARAIVLEYQSEPMGNHEFVRYRIRTLSPAPQREGWVHKDQAPVAGAPDSSRSKGP